MTRLIAVVGICTALLAAAVSTATEGPHGASAGQVVVVDATPNTATNVINTDHTVTATVTFNGSPLSGATVVFNVTSGPNAGQTASPTTTVNAPAQLPVTGGGSNGSSGFPWVIAVVSAVSAAAFVGGRFVLSRVR